jgi:hypothetical protein
MNVTVTNLKQAQLRARAPRLLFYVFILILCLSGLRSIVGGPAAATAPPPVAASPVDWTATSYAQDFARAYLTWGSEEPQAEREQRLAPFLAGDLDPGAGVDPADGADQAVAWTSVVGVRRVGDRELVTVHVGTSNDQLYLAVPVDRTEDGKLGIPAYPAIVGPPASDTRARDADEPRVEDGALRTVAERALRNYLQLNRDDLMADLAPGAVVAPPGAALELAHVADTTWVTEGRRVAVQATTEDEQGTELTLRYELDVVKSDRWYVRSVHIDPTYTGGRSEP